MFVKPLFLFLSSVVARTLAHGGVQSYIINNQEYLGFEPYTPAEQQTTIARPWTSIDPMYGANNPALACNNDGLGVAAKGGVQLSAPIKAGDSIVAVWGYWIHPFGPAMVYMARCPGSCSSVNSNDLKWFKIEHQGLISGSIYDGKWAGGTVVATGVYHATIPAALADGEYLIRHELVALHGLATGGAQFYVECAQLTVTGGGGKLPPSRFLVTFPGAYKDTDPGFHIDLYNPESDNITTYDIPGPSVWNGEDI